MKRSFVMFVIAAMVLGFITGMIVHGATSPAGAKQAADGFSQVTNIFLRLIKMIIAPLVLTTLTSGIGHIESAATVGRIGTKAMIWFLTASFVALLIGLVMVNILQPGLGAGVAQAAGSVAEAGVGPAQGVGGFLEHLIPSSIIDAMARNEILQVVVFSLFAGIAISAVGEKAKALLHVIEQAATVILKVTTYVMMFAPIAIFAAIASAISTQGVGILVTYAKLVGDFYISISLLIALMIFVAWLVVGAQMRPLLKAIRSPALIAFSTSTSEAAFPLLLESLEAMGFSSKIVSFVLPLGYSFNLVGSTMYCTFAAMFIAQAYNIHVPISQQILMLLMLMVTSKGIAGVPRASLVVVAATLPYFNLPEQGLFLILAVDHLMDMGRSATNVIGNGLASAVVAKWENARPMPIAARPEAIV
ncbi:MAG TPA: dicarboxylate/amino acid:cation symporter [Rhizomicrobium sp.]|jgi:Na+/H+-dicarboxylate symporter|nr:dicarboxylate/amino acid:cation symporter [Rhizomicrobium sp.]